MEGSENGISRRSVLKRIGAGAAIAWVTPVITSMNTPAFARSLVEARCDNPTPCVNFCGAACGCVPTTEGGPGFCHQGRFCPDVADCASSGDCPPGTRCVSTCCNVLICAAPCGAGGAAYEAGGSIG